ncbi:MAG: cyclase family protein [Candidatus Micrarchaeia archaeon]
MNKLKIYDISMGIYEGMAVYPGDPPVKITRVKVMPANSSNVSLISMGSHTGTHVDAPAHIMNGAITVDSLPLEKMCGPCRLLDLMDVDGGIERQRIEKENIQEGEIILLKTKNSLHGYSDFREDFIHITPECAEFLAKTRIKALGVDYLSVQKYKAGNNFVHTAIINSGIILYEGLVLSNIKPGRYFFVGLPLKIRGCDGAPARCILIEGL